MELEWKKWVHISILVSVIYLLEYGMDGFGKMDSLEQEFQWRSDLELQSFPILSIFIYLSLASLVALSSLSCIFSPFA